MSRLTAEHETSLSRSPSEEWRRGSAFAEPVTAGERSPGWLVAGLVTVGLGAFAWYYFGPDLRRYLKIRDM